MVRRYALVIYFALCYLISWAVWIPAGLWAPEANLLVIVGAWAPTIASLLLTWLTDGRDGLRRLLRGLLRWRVSIGYYAFAVLSVLGLALLALGLHVLLGGSPPALAEIAVQYGLPAEQAQLLLVFWPIIYLTTIFVGGPIAEELGWRGFAQPRMQARVGAGWAGLAIGLIWSLWHLPLFAFFPSGVASLPLGYYIPLVTALGVFFAWLYNRTGGSVLLCILLHAGVNFALGVIGGGALSEDRSLLTILVVLVVILAAVLFLQIRSVTEVHTYRGE